MTDPLATIITTTSHVPSNPSTVQIEQTLRSIRKYSELSAAPHIVVCDGLKDGTPAQQQDYRMYVDKLRSLASSDAPCDANPFCNTTVLELPEHRHIAHAIKAAADTVETPLIGVHQHDFEWKGNYHR